MQKASLLILLKSLMLFTSVSAEDPTDDSRLVAQYLFEGNHDDSSGNGFHAAELGTFSLQGDLNPLADLLAADPERGGVYSYTNAELFYDWGNGGNPRNNCINLEASFQLPNVPEDFGITLMAWVKREAVHTMNNGGNVYDGSIFQLGNCGDLPIATMGIRSDGTLTGYLEGDLVGGGEQVLISSDSLVPPNEWHHLTIVYDRVVDLAYEVLRTVAECSEVSVREIQFSVSY